MNKSYKTRNGASVTLITVTARGDLPVMGYIGTSTTVDTWQADGCYRHDRVISVNDLIESQVCVGSKRYLVQGGDEVYLCLVNEHSGVVPQDHPDFIRWIDTEWQYHEISNTPQGEQE